MKKKCFTPHFYTDSYRLKRAGFTLVETLIVSVVLIILMGILTTALIESNFIFQAADVQTMLQGKASIAMDRIGFDLRRTSRTEVAITQDSPSAGTDTILYHLPLDSDSDGTPDLTGGWDLANITIGLDPAGTGRLLRVEGANTTVLASNVKRINFIDHSIDAALYLNELKIIIELEKADSQGRLYNMIFTACINMRN